MKHYICVNGQNRELTEDQAKKILEQIDKETPKVQLGEIEPGKTFRIGNHDFIVLEHVAGDTAVIRRDILRECLFGKTNNFVGSDAELLCKKFADELAEIIGEENIAEHKVDLTSNDGLKDYGVIRTRCSMLTADLYRRYVDILDEYKPKSWWWLATPFSTKRHESEKYVICVSPAGCIFGVNYFGGTRGVRPFCILKSTIFVSK